MNAGSLIVLASKVASPASLGYLMLFQQIWTEEKIDSTIIFTINRQTKLKTQGSDAFIKEVIVITPIAITHNHPNKLRTKNNENRATPSKIHNKIVRWLCLRSTIKKKGITASKG